MTSVERLQHFLEIAPEGLPTAGPAGPEGKLPRGGVVAQNMQVGAAV
jgi:hypothetical protein